MKKKILCTVFAVFILMVLGNFTFAATAKITASKTTATVGDSVTITVTINAAAWNIKPSGAISGTTLAGFNIDGVNQTTTQTYKLDTSKAGTYTAKITGDITDANGDNPDINTSVVVTVKEKEVKPPENNNTGTGSSSTTTQKPNNTTTVTKSSDATLKALKLNVDGLNPVFNKNTYLYTLTVSSEVNSIKVTASTNHSKAKYSVSGNSNLKNGDNTILVTVTAEKGNTKTYKIIVTKAEDPEKANAYLTNIVLDNATLNEEFVRENMEYTLQDVTYDVTKLQLSAFPENSKATVVIDGNDELKVGENVIKITVTAEDGKTTKEYTIKVNRKEEPKTALPNDIIEQNPLTQTNVNNSSEEKLTYESQLLILVYIFAVAEFIEIIYLFWQLRDKDSNKDNSIDIPRYNRRKSKKDEE